MKKITTLCIIHQHPKILLGMKKVGSESGKWNGFESIVQAGDSIEETVRKSIKESCGITVSSMEKVGEIIFSSEDNQDEKEMHIFKIDDFYGEQKESDELKPQWFFMDEIPFTDMLPDSKYWMPFFLQNKKFIGRFIVDSDNNIIDRNLDIVDEI